MEEENPVYVKLEYYESLASKRDLLSSEKILLNIIRIIKRYHAIKLEQLRMRSHLHKSVKELDLLIKKVKSSFPFVDIPELTKHEELIKEIDAEKEDSEEDIELQLEEIQRKLDALNV